MKILTKVLYFSQVMLRFNNSVPLIGAALFGSAMNSWPILLLLVAAWTGVVFWDEKLKGNI